MRSVVVVAVTTLSISAASVPAQEGTSPKSVDALAFMAGTWEADLWGGTFQEHWMAPRGGMLIGAGRHIREGKAGFFEWFRISETADGIEYAVRPADRETVTFRLTEAGDGWARFTNPAHERQHTIEYRKVAGGLRGRIAGVRDGKPWEETLAFRPSAAPPAPPADPSRPSPLDATLENPVPLFAIHAAPGHKWQAGIPGPQQPGIEQHIGHLEALKASGHLVMAGPYLDGTGGLTLVRARDQAEADALAAADPSGKSGLLVFTVRPWLVAVASR